MGSRHRQELTPSLPPLMPVGSFWGKVVFFHGCWWFGALSATSEMPGGCGRPTLAGKAGSDSLPSLALPAG